MSENVKIELSNGLVIQGSFGVVESTLHRLGFGYLVKTIKRNPLEWHFSESKQQWVRVEDMPAKYIANVIKKMIKEKFPRQDKYMQQTIADEVFDVIDTPDFHGLFEAYMEQKDEGNLDE